MDKFREQFQVPREGLSARHLFWILQESAGHHSTLLGFGEEKMKSLGLMWVVIRYRVEVARYPAAGESITVETWPGPVRHGFCPRAYNLLDGSGALLLRACATWAVVDRESRKMVSPQERGVNLEPLVTGEEIPQGGAIRKPVTDRERRFVVPAEYLDSNGHMNNTTYFDLAEESIERRAALSGLKQVSVEYVNEALQGEEMSVRWGYDGESYTVTGDAESGPVFRMKLKYAEA